MMGGGRVTVKGTNTQSDRISTFFSYEAMPWRFGSFVWWKLMIVLVLSVKACSTVGEAWMGVSLFHTKTIRATSSCWQRHSSFLLARDTDDEYYLRLFEEDNRKREEAASPINMDKEETRLRYERAEEAYQEHRENLREWNYELGKLKHKGRQTRTLKRREKKRKRIARLAEQATRRILELNRAPSKDDAEIYNRYHIVLGVYTRLFEKLAVMEEEALDRAKAFVWERERALASSNASESRRTNIQEIKEIRSKEKRERETFIDTVLSRDVPSNYEQLRTEDILAILSVRGNVKGIGRAKRRERVLELFRQSYEVDLF